MQNVNVKSQSNQTGSIKLLSVFLGLVFVGIGMLIVQNPQGWLYFFPKFVLDIMGANALWLSYAVAVFDFAVGAALVAGKLVRLASALAALHLVGVVIFNRTDISVNIRDFGLFGMALAIYLEAGRSSRDQEV